MSKDTFYYMEGLLFIDKKWVDTLNVSYDQIEAFASTAWTFFL